MYCALIEFWLCTYRSTEYKLFEVKQIITLWFQLEDMFQLIVTPQGNEKVTIQLKDTPTKVYAIGAKLFLSKVCSIKAPSKSPTKIQTDFVSSYANGHIDKHPV